MRIFILFLFLIFNLSFAQESTPFHSPSARDLVEVSVGILDHVEETLKTPLAKNCDGIKEAAKKEVPKEEAFCVCQLKNTGPRKKIKDTNIFVGEVDSTQWKVVTGNDNFLHGVLQLNPALKKYDGDDRGRTFSIGANYKIVGSDGEFSVNALSTGFGKFDPQTVVYNIPSLGGGSSQQSVQFNRDPDGLYYLNFREVNSVDTRLDFNFDKKNSDTLQTKSYFISDLKFEQATDNGYMAHDIQKFWHKTAKELSSKTIQYHYLKENGDINTLTLKGGVGKEWIKDVGNWKCATRAEVMASVNFANADSANTTTPEISANGSVQLTNTQVPWLALSMWLSGSESSEDSKREGGVEISFPIKRKNYVIKPFIGIERHKTKLDTEYGQENGKPYENFHILGVVVKY